MLTKIKQALKKYHKQVWVMYNQDNIDPYFCKYIAKNLSSGTLCFISPKVSYLLIHALDEANLKKEIYNEENVHIIVYRTVEELESLVEEVIAKLGFPEDISLSYTTMGDNSTDVIGHGKYVSLTKLLKKPYRTYSKKVKFSSAEEIIYDIASQKTPLQIERLKYMANITLTILEETISRITIGMSEIAIVDLTLECMHEIMKKHIGTHGMVEYGVAWENCPIVLVGENLAKGGHSIPSNKMLQRGETIYFDYGIQVTFEDGETLYTDMQRMGYVLQQDEKEAPKSVQKVFHTLVTSIEEGIEEMKPGVNAFKIDQIVRGMILQEGYPDYNHATGHPVGEEVHDMGAIISVKASRRARLPLVENGIYTLEPRANIANGGSIEEMIQVTKYGGIPLCDTQKKLYYIK